MKIPFILLLTLLYIKPLYSQWNELKSNYNIKQHLHLKYKVRKIMEYHYNNYDSTSKYHTMMFDTVGWVTSDSSKMGIIYYQYSPDGFIQAYQVKYTNGNYENDTFIYNADKTNVKKETDASNNTSTYFEFNESGKLLKTTWGNYVHQYYYIENGTEIHDSEYYHGKILKCDISLLDEQGNLKKKVSHTRLCNKYDETIFEYDLNGELKSITNTRTGKIVTQYINEKLDKYGNWILRKEIDLSNNHEYYIKRTIEYY